MLAAPKRVDVKATSSRFRLVARDLWALGHASSDDAGVREQKPRRKAARRYPCACLDALRPRGLRSPTCARTPHAL